MRTFNRLIIVKLCFIIVMSFLNKVNAEEESLDQSLIVEEMIDQLEGEEVHSFWLELQDEYGDYLEQLRSKSFIEMIKEKEAFSFRSIIKGIFKFLFYELMANGKLLGILIIFTILSVMLQMIVHAFEGESVSKVVDFIIFIVLMQITLHSFYLTITYAQDAIESMSNFIIALFPLMLAIIASLGQLTSVAFFHPLVLLLIHFSTIILGKFVFPLIYISALLMIVSEFNERFKVTHLAQLLRTISLGTLTIFVAVFVTVFSLQGAATSIQDGVALKTTKFIASNLVPVVGTSLTDAADTILSSALIVKNALGIVGLLIIILIATFPAIKIAIIAFIYKLVAALLQPLGPNAVINNLHVMSTYIMYVLGCLVVITFAFFITIVMIIAASNLPLLLR